MNSIMRKQEINQEICCKQNGRIALMAEQRFEAPWLQVLPKAFGIVSSARVKCGKSKIEKQNLNGASPIPLHKEQMLATKKLPRISRMHTNKNHS